MKMNPSHHPTAQERTLAAQLRHHGYKLTQARRAVIRVLATSDKPLAIGDLHHQAQALAADLGLVTVYRTLELLLDLNLVRPVHLLENCHGYALATPGHTHHLICRRCHNVVEIQGCDLSPFLDRVAAQTGYRVTGHWLEVEGLCPACQGLAAPESAESAESAEWQNE